MKKRKDHALFFQTVLGKLASSSLTFRPKFAILCFSHVSLRCLTISAMRGLLAELNLVRYTIRLPA